MLKLVLVDKKELARGEKEEAEEHGFSPDIAKRTVLDHLTKKDPHYYTKLAQYDLEEEGLDEEIKTGKNFPFDSTKVAGGRMKRLKGKKNITVVGGSNLMPST